MKKLQLAAIAAAVTLAAGCTNMNPAQQGTVTGAGLGALGGAGIAAIAGGDAWTGAAIGAVAGGIAGNIHGNNQMQAGW